MERPAVSPCGRLSRYPEIAILEFASSAHVIAHLKSIFSRHGIPETVQSDNGSQYSSEAFKQFAHQFEHLTSSPRYPQSNEEAERMLQTIKKSF
jgi:transposase InsO family protein